MSPRYIFRTFQNKSDTHILIDIYEPTIPRTRKKRTRGISKKPHSDEEEEDEEEMDEEEEEESPSPPRRRRSSTSKGTLEATQDIPSPESVVSPTSPRSPEKATTPVTQSQLTTPSPVSVKKESPFATDGDDGSKPKRSMYHFTILYT